MINKIRPIYRTALGQLLLLPALFLLMAAFIMTPAAAIDTGQEQIEVCVGGQPCKFYASTQRFQQALDDVMAFPNHPATITLQPGVYTHTQPMSTVVQIAWRGEEGTCVPYTYGTTFLLEKRMAPTLIQGATGNPADVVILGGLPSWTNTYSNVVYGLSLNNNTGLVTISDLTIMTNGGKTANGTGDGALNVINTNGWLTHSIIAANKTDANPLYREWLEEEKGYKLDIDSEGVYLYGPSTYFTIVHSLMGGNFHTGVMLAEDAHAWIIGSLIRGNGWFPASWGDYNEYTGKGQGVVTLGGFTHCYRENTQAKIWNTIIMRNSGAGILLRGHFTDTVTGIAHNTIEQNAQYGILLEVLTLDTPNISVFIANNVVLSNSVGGISISNSISSTQGATIKLYNNSSSGHPADKNYLPPGLEGVVGYTERSANLSPADPRVHPETFRLLPGSPLAAAGWGAPPPDISSYDRVNLKHYAFHEETLGLWCGLHSALHKVDPTYQNPCLTHQLYLPLSLKTLSAAVRH
ncbi:MAG TPA: right-handed parallel beta-helix repeat-containing protein [Anaerolineae bacterium]|nr:right-handed parallel beta-helix repeat-containing protein [Anaerolineae bacterium]